MMAARGERLHPKARGAAVAAASRTAAQISLEAMQGLHTATAPAPMPYSDADVLLLDRLLALEPALRAQHREARARKQNVHGPKGLIADESVLLANAARHTGFDLDDPISSHTNKELKQLQLDTRPAADASRLKLKRYLYLACACRATHFAVAFSRRQLAQKAQEQVRDAGAPVFCGML